MASDCKDAVDCEDFQRRLPELVAAGDGYLYRDPYLKNCAECRALAVDLETIAEASRDLFGTDD